MNKWLVNDQWFNKLGSFKPKTSAKFTQVKYHNGKEHLQILGGGIHPTLEPHVSVTNWIRDIVNGAN